MLVRKAYRYRLEPNAAQRQLFVEYAGCRRFVWNKALELNLYRLDHKRPIIRYYDMAGYLCLWKKSEEYAFLAQANAQVLQQALKDLDRAFADAFDRNQPGKRMPNFKRKGQGDAFRFPQSVRVEGDRVFLPKIGLVRMRLSRKIDGEIRNATVSMRGGHWFVSIQTEVEVAEPVHDSDTAIGIDRGVVNLMTLSDGTVFKGAKPLKRLLRKLARQQRMLSRKTKFSNNWRKQRDRITRLHIKIADARLDAIHKATTTISKNHAVVCLEDLRTKNMTRSAKGTVDAPGSNVSQKAGLNRSILDMGWFETCRQLQYKQRWRGGQVVLVPAPHTSTTCSVCGHRDKANRRSQSVFNCVACGHRENADINAAKNILAAGLAATACGGIGRKPPVEAGTGGAAMLPLLEAA